MLAMTLKISCANATCTAVTISYFCFSQEIPGPTQVVEIPGFFDQLEWSPTVQLLKNYDN